MKELIERGQVSSQSELAEALAADGIVVHQATISKDLVELGAVRQRDASGALTYVILADQPEHAAGERLDRLATGLLLSATASSNLVVLKTPAGAAQYFASAIDRAGWESILGTIAGDDTVLVIAKDPAGGDALAEQFAELGRPGMSNG